MGGVLGVVSQPEGITSPRGIVPGAYIGHQHDPPSPVSMARLLQSVISAVAGQHDPPSAVSTAQRLSPGAGQSG